MKKSINLPFDRFGTPGTTSELILLVEGAGETRDDAARLADAEEREFSVSAILQKSPLHDTDIHLSVDVELGGSYLLGPQKTAGENYISTAGGGLTIVHNTKGEFAKLKFSCTANSGDAALAKFYAIVSPILDHLSYVGKVPVYLTRSEWIDLKNSVHGYNHTNPYIPVIPAGDGLMQVHVQPLYALYREAKNAASPYYRFLCFYKILEGTSKIVRPKFFQRAKDRGVNPVRIKELVPDDPQLREDYAELIGKPVQEVANGLLQDMRQEVAHYLLDSGSVMLVSDHATVTRFEKALWLVELCARVMIDTQEHYERQLA